MGVANGRQAVSKTADAGSNPATHANLPVLKGRHVVCRIVFGQGVVIRAEQLKVVVSVVAVVAVLVMDVQRNAVVNGMPFGPTADFALLSSEMN